MRQWKWLAILGVLLITTIGLLSVPPKTVSASAIDINADRSALTGDHSISYQQISIRTNRTPERTNFDQIVQRADDAAAQFPIED